MAKKELKTNVMRVLDSKKLAYNHYAYDNSTVNGVEVAQLRGQDPDRVFKTLVTQGKSGGFFVFMVPVAEELDLKKAARACGEKAVEMLPQKELLPRTGYVHGGCSPIGMKKQYVTRIDESAKTQEQIYVSGGKIGSQIRLTPEDLAKAAKAEFADIIRHEN